MNFLAHILLSGEDEGLIIGNFIADFVKGAKKESYDSNLRNGMRLHHRIDAFTDTHPMTLRAISRIKSSQGRYSSVVVDIFFDHFLAKDFVKYHETTLEIFSQNFYRIAFRYRDLLPERVQRMLDVMKVQNWLLNYGDINGLGSIMNQFSKRVNHKNNIENAIDSLNQNYAGLKMDFDLFFPELSDYISIERRKLLPNSKTVIKTQFNGN